jgi:hypothetical protein
VVGAQREANAVDRRRGCRADRSLGPEAHTASGGPRAYQRRLALGLHGANERTLAAQEHSVASDAGQAVGPRRHDVSLHRMVRAVRRPHRHGGECTEPPPTARSVLGSGTADKM